MNIMMIKNSMLNWVSYTFKCVIEWLLNFESKVGYSGDADPLSGHIDPHQG